MGPDTRRGRARRLLTVPRAPPHLGAECGLLVEIAVHELTVFARGDLTAGDGEARADVRGLSPDPLPGVQRLAAARIAGRMGAPLQGPSQHGRRGQGGQQQRRSTGARARGPGRLTCPWCRCSRDGPGSGSPCAGSPSGYSWPAPCRSAGRSTERRWGCAAARCLPALPGPLSSPHTHRPLGDVVGPDVGTTRGRLLAGSGGRSWRGQNVGPWHPQLATPPGPHPAGHTHQQHPHGWHQ